MIWDAYQYLLFKLCERPDITFVILLVSLIIIIGVMIAMWQLMKKIDALEERNKLLRTNYDGLLSDKQELLERLSLKEEK